VSLAWLKAVFNGTSTCMVHASINKCTAVCKLVADTDRFSGIPRDKCHVIFLDSSARGIARAAAFPLLPVESQENLDEQDDF